MPYPIVIAKADLIVDGTVSKVSKNTYEFKVDQFVKGKSNSRINVVIWKEWLCDPRMKELKPGQRLILFLKRNAFGTFYSINDSTGELYIDNDNFINIFIAKDFVNPTIFKEGVKMFLKTFTACGDFNDRFFGDGYFLSNKSIFEIYKMEEDNQVFKYLVDRQMNYSNIQYSTTLQFSN